VFAAVLPPVNVLTLNVFDMIYPNAIANATAVPAVSKPVLSMPSSVAASTLVTEAPSPEKLFAVIVPVAVIAVTLSVAVEKSFRCDMISRNASLTLLGSIVSDVFIPPTLSLLEAVAS